MLRMRGGGPLARNNPQLPQPDLKQQLQVERDTNATLRKQVESQTNRSRQQDRELESLKIENRNLKVDNERLSGEANDSNRRYKEESEKVKDLREKLHRLTGKEEAEEMPEGASTPPRTPDLFDQYDLTLDITSLKEICTAKAVKLFASIASTFNIHSFQRLKIIAVLGLFDKGKSFIINKLFGKNLPHGKMHTTQGLRFLYLEADGILVIDSQGVQATVSYKKSEERDDVDPTVDAQLTESLVFRVISELAHHVLFVCNDLTWNEQKYLQMLAGSDKSLVVAVHNLQTTIVSSEARSIFGNQIERCYKGSYVSAAQGDGEGLFFASEDIVHSSKTSNMLHVGVAKEGTQAGDKYNNKSYNRIKEFMRNAGTHGLSGEEMIFSNRLSTVLQKFLPAHLFLTGDILKREITVKATDPPEPIHSEIFGTLVKSFVLADDHQALSMKAHGVTDSLGMMIYHHSEFEPIVNDYTIREEYGGETVDMRYLTIEAPGIADDEEHLEVTLGDGGEVDIVMTKTKFVDEAQATPYNASTNPNELARPIRQQSGRLVHKIHLTRHELTEPLYTLKDGMFVMKMKLKKPPKRNKLHTQLEILREKKAGFDEYNTPVPEKLAEEIREVERKIEESQRQAIARSDSN